MEPISVFDLPPEILEHILSSLPPADILKMKEVCRLFLDLVSNSQLLQHRIDLFSAGLVDNPHTMYSLAERRALLCKYVDAWKDTEPSVRYDCLPITEMDEFNPSPIGQDLFSEPSADCTTLHFFRVPSSPSQGTIKEWTLEFPFRFSDYFVRLQDNLLVVFQQEIWPMNIHLLSLLDGTPHEAPRQKVLKLDLGRDRDYGHGFTHKRINESRMAIVVHPPFEIPMRYRRDGLIAWDWRTGEVVLKYLNAFPKITDICLLEGSWLLLSHQNDIPRLVIFNTQLPQQDPQSWLILKLPTDPRFRYYSIITQCENSSAERSRFLVDPAQRILALSFLGGPLLVVPVELLIQYAHTVSSSVPWDEWGGDVTAMELHPHASNFQIFDTKVLALRQSVNTSEVCGVDVYDLSRSGRRNIQARRVNSLRVLPIPNWFVPCHKGDEFYHSVSILGNVVYFFRKLPSTEGYSLRVCRLGEA